MHTVMHTSMYVDAYIPIMWDYLHFSHLKLGGTFFSKSVESGVSFSLGNSG